MKVKNASITRALAALIMLPWFAPTSGQEAEQTQTEREEIIVWGEDGSNGSGASNSSVSLVTPEDLLSVNVTTTEDLVKHEPSLVVRRRFIGDANGTLGIRGSNMFQTPRSMVFADGVPLHYFLQSRWNGAPRWTLVSASEIAQVEVIYGPFSAEYSGNAMGGVVLIETAIPREREFHFDAAYFSQQFDAYGFDDTVSGHKQFFSYGDRFDDLSLYVSYNRLRGQSQPQSFFPGDASNTGNPQPVSGAIAERDELGNPQRYFGDSGVIDTETDNVKFKTGYEFGDWMALFNLAYEDRRSEADSANSYLRGTTGAIGWSGEFMQNGHAFSVPASGLNVSDSERRSLSAGLRLRGDLSDSAALEVNLNRFDILRDEQRSSSANPADPTWSPAGQVTDFDNTGWQTAEVKLNLGELGLPGLELVTGLRHERYRLHIDVYDSNNYAAGRKDTYSDRSGGETAITAGFAQLNWAVDSRWDLAVGGRLERWQSRAGYYAEDDPNTAILDLQHLPARSRSEFSPKFSLGFQPEENWLLRYSLARAFRFPIVEELFSQYQAFNAINEANPDLRPEKGLHHNLMLERQLQLGYWRINLFAEDIEDVIEAQSTTLPGGASLRTFIPIDEVQTWGAELVANVFDLLPSTDIRFNIAYTQAKIVKNNADTAIEGNRFPRMPEWRANLLATYHINPRWNVGGSLQYASDSYGRLDNADKQDNVYGAQDAYTRIGLKGNVQLTEHVAFALGIDNLRNEIDYVAHPWPGRTYYLNVSYDY
ncbi:MAG: TonB-dependent receptor [Cellvibrionaceae bacterium]